MIAFLIIVLVLLLLILPVGLRIAYHEQLSLKLIIGPLKLRILPQAHEKPKLSESKKKEKVKVPKEHKKFRLTTADIFELLRIVLQALRRLRKFVSIDLLRLHLTVSAEDPYDAVMRYGALNAGLSTLMPLVACVLKIREEDIQTFVDLERQKPVIRAEFAATLQIWEILVIGVCAIISLLRWYINKKKLDHGADSRTEEKG